MDNPNAWLEILKKETPATDEDIETVKAAWQRSAEVVSNVYFTPWLERNKHRVLDFARRAKADT